MKKKQYDRLHKILNGIGVIFIGGMLLWRVFIGAVIGAIVLGFLGENILLGALVGGSFSTFIFLFSEDGLALGEDDDFFGGLILSGFIGSVAVGTVMSFLGQNVLHGILVGAGVGIGLVVVYALLSKDRAA